MYSRKSIPFLIALVVAFGCGSPGESPSQSAAAAEEPKRFPGDSDESIKARAMIESGKLDESLAYITQVLEQRPQDKMLLKQAAEKGMSTEPMQDYLNAFRYGCPPHGGLGMGLGRVLMVMLGLDSIREATFLFRGPNRLTP